MESIDSTVAAKWLTHITNIRCRSIKNFFFYFLNLWNDFFPWCFFHRTTRREFFSFSLYFSRLSKAFGARSAFSLCLALIMELLLWNSEKKCLHNSFFSKAPTSIKKVKVTAVKAKKRFSRSFVLVFLFASQEKFRKVVVWNGPKKSEKSFFFLLPAWRVNDKKNR